MAVDISPQQDGGILKEILTEGSGVENPQKNCIVTAHYHGTLTDGTVFDSSVERGQPFQFTVGVGQVIKAWDIGVLTMKKDEKARFTCKADYAYGARGSPPKIPPNSTLIFDITLLSWTFEDLSPTKDGGITRVIIESGNDSGTGPEEFALCKVRLKGTLEDRIFEDREISFNVGEGSEVGVPKGVEIALTKMVRGEKSRITLQPNWHWPDGNEQLGIPPMSVVRYDVELIEYDQEQSWNMDAPDKIAKAKLLKERATEYFKANKFELSSKLYNKAMTFIDQDNGFSETESEERKKLVLAIHLNLGLVHLKLAQPYEAQRELDKALELDPDNVKGLFRRGQAYLATKEPVKAMEDFEKVTKLEPNNKAAVAQINVCKKEIRLFKQREKQIYTNMFEKFARKDQEDIYRFGWWDDLQKQPLLPKIEPPDNEEVEDRKRERKKQLEHLKKLAEAKRKQREEEEALKKKKEEEEALKKKQEEETTENAELTDEKKEDVANDVKGNEEKAEEIKTNSSISQGGFSEEASSGHDVGPGGVV